jgi:hypothetical protein
MSQKSGGVFPVFIVTILIPLLLGMGSTGAGAPGKIPVPAKKFMAIVIDQVDVSTEAHEISIEGETFLPGKKGEGTFTISFENIQFVSFLMNDGKLFGYAKLKDGKTVQLELNKGNKLYGKTSYGTFQIPLGDLKRLTITNRGK